MEIDPSNPVVALCAEGMAVGGDASAAAACFARAWDARRDDFDSAIAAHYLARCQATAAARLEWDARAAGHAESAAVSGDSRVQGLFASLYLNLGDSLLAVGRREEARDAVRRAESALATLPGDGYRELVATGVTRLAERIEASAADVDAI